jgi:hypothetical protein
MPVELLHLQDEELDRAGVDPSLLAAFRSYLPGALDDRRGLAILAPSAAGTHMMLMVLARRIGAALRDANIHLRDRGGDLKIGRQKLCYLPGQALAAALTTPSTRQALAGEAACFFQDVDGAWPAEHAESEWLDPDELLGLLDQRLAAGRPTFLQATADRLPSGLEGEIRARLPILERGPGQQRGGDL